MDINTILTIFGAPADCKELIRALAADVRELRERNSALVRELEAAQMALTALEQSPPNDSPPPTPAKPAIMTRDQILRIAREALRTGHKVRVVTAHATWDTRISQVEDSETDDEPVKCETPNPSTGYDWQEIANRDEGIRTMELLSQAAPTADLNELLRAAAARGQLARVTLADVCEPLHNGTLEGVPYYSSGGTDDTAPWSVHGYWCGTASECDRGRIIAVELL